MYCSIVPFAAPLDRRFKIFLPDRAAPEIVARQPLGRAIRLAEITLGISRPRPGIDGVAQFLIGEFLARDVNGPEPLQSFAVGPGAEIDHQLVIKNPLLLVVLEIVKGQTV